MALSSNCPLCSYFAAPTMDGVVRHIGAVHAHQADFSICCGIGGCPRTYKKFHSYRQHMLRHHKETSAPRPSTDLSLLNSSEPEGNSYNDDSSVMADGPGAIFDNERSLSLSS